MKKFLILIVAIVLGSCSRKDANMTSVALFFDPSQAFNFEKVRVRATLGTDVVMDTVVTNTRVNTSLLLKCLELDVTTNKQLTFSINGKSKVVTLEKPKGNCLSIFTWYDDHSKMQEIYQKVEMEKARNGQMIDTKVLMDSIRQSQSTIAYDSIIVDIQQNKCWCGKNNTKKLEKK